MATAKSSNFTFRIENDVKAEAEALFNELGLSLSTAINIFVRQAIQSHGFPFAIKRNTPPNKTTLAAMQEAVALATDPNAKLYSSAKEVLEDDDA